MDPQEFDLIEQALAESFHEHRSIIVRLFDEYGDIELTGVVVLIHTFKRESNCPLAKVIGIGLRLMRLFRQIEDSIFEEEPLEIKILMALPTIYEANWGRTLLLAAIIDLLLLTTKRVNACNIRILEIHSVSLRAYIRT